LEVEMGDATVEPFSAKLARLNAWMLERAGLILGPGALFLVIRVILDFAGRLHWALELLITLLLAALLALILTGLRGPTLDQLRIQHPLRVTIGIFLFVTLLAVTVFSALSVLLWRWQPDSYSGATAYTPGKFADFYSWHLLESLPGLKLMSTYGISAPVTPHGAEAATLVLLFRAVVIVRLLAAARSWFRSPGGRRVENSASAA
jgi:hypothetical protein